MAVECDGKFEASVMPPDFVKVLGAMESDAVVTFEAINGKKPLRLTCGNYLFIAMPLHKNEDAS